MLKHDTEQFQEIPLSYISSHYADCCQIARATLMARIESNTIAEELAVIPEVVKWSPVQWPVYWCKITDNGDCGVHAALADVVLKQRFIYCAQVQTAIQSPPGMIKHWQTTWSAAEVRADWIGSCSVYHETLWINGRFWDPSEARWFSGVGDYLLAGRVAAVRRPGQVWEYQNSNRS